MGHLTRTIALVGMMGAGKSAIGRRLATRMGVEFRDADDEIEAAAGRTIPEIFREFGEASFRACEQKIILRLLDEAPHVLATGGGAFMSAETRGGIKEKAFSVWLKAPVEVLLERVQRKGNRPLLKNGNPRETLERLLQEREPTYAEADLMIESREAPHQQTVSGLLAALTERGIWVP